MVFHFFRKDVRHSAWLLSLWFLLFVLDGILALSAPPPDINHSDMAAILGWGPLLFLVLQFLVFVVLLESAEFLRGGQG